MTSTIAVLVRRVPDPERLSVDRRTGRLIIEDIPFILNPVDLEALEHALRLREAHQVRIVVLSVDHTGAQSELREALSLGADEAILLSDPEFEATDPGAQAHLLRHALERWVRPRLVLAASRSIDHTWSTIGPQLAHLLDWPLVIEAEALSMEGDCLEALAHTGERRARVEAPLPCVVTVARGAVVPRTATAWGVADAFDAHRLSVRGLEDLDVPRELRASFLPRTRVRRVSQPPHERGRRMIEGEPDDVARIIARRLIDQGWGGQRR